MNFKKIHMKKVLSITKWALVYFILGLHLPTNNIGNCTAQRSKPFFPIPSNTTVSSKHLSSNLSTREEYPTIHGDDPTFRLVTGSYAIFSSIAFTISTASLGIAWAYLNSICTAKQCILTYLYKDASLIWTLINILWLVRVILCYFTTNGLGIGIIEGKLLTFLLLVLFLLFEIIINSIAIIKFYIAKTVMLDPPMPWDDDELLGIKVIRIASCTFAFAITFVSYAIGHFPKLYYFFTVSHNSSTRLLKFNVSIFPFLIVLFFITFIVISIGEKYQKITKSKLIDTNVPREIDYYFWTILIISVLLYLIHSTRALEIFNRPTRLEIWQMSMSILVSVPPILVILKTKQLKIYALKMLDDIFYEVFLLSIYITPCLLMILINGVIYILL